MVLRNANSPLHTPPFASQRFCTLTPSKHTETQLIHSPKFQQEVLGGPPWTSTGCLCSRVERWWLFGSQRNSFVTYRVGPISQLKEKKNRQHRMKLQWHFKIWLPLENHLCNPSSALQCFKPMKPELLWWSGVVEMVLVIDLWGQGSLLR